MTDHTTPPNPDRMTPTPGQVARVDRALKMMEMRAAGWSYFDIAAHFEVTRAAAHAAVLKALDYQRERLSEKVEQVRALELGRLDQLHMAVWPKALEGDLHAADRVLDIMSRRARYTGADMPAKIAPTDPSGEKSFTREYVGIDPQEV